MMLGRALVAGTRVGRVRAQVSVRAATRAGAAAGACRALTVVEPLPTPKVVTETGERFLKMREEYLALNVP